MTYRFLFTSLTLTVLLLQIVSLKPNITPTFKTIAYGAIGALEEKVKPQFTKRPIEARYLAESKKVYDSLVIVGDVMMARNVEQLMKRNGPDYPFAGVELSDFASNPAIIGNFESSMALEHTQTPVNQLKFSTNQEHIEALKEAGFTHLSLANNHSFDYGVSGYNNAVTLLEKLDIETFGQEYAVNNSSISYIETSNGTFALIGINASDGRLSSEQIEEVMQTAKAKSSFQIVYIHWGIEYATAHHVSQETLAEKLIALGADLIVGHHPHVVQDIAVIDGVPVFYSLGNYIFDQYFSADVQEGMVLSVSLSDEPSISIIPVISETYMSQPTLMNETQHAAFLKKLAASSDSELKESILSGTIPLYEPVATSIKTAMMSR